MTPAQAHQIALELAERFFPSCEVLVATHVDAEHSHSRCGESVGSSSSSPR